jgi:glycosyltransferase involved in cell wall biosynthesis
MHICLFTPTFLPKIGGAEAAVDAIARGLSARGHDVTVAAQEPSKEQALVLDPAGLPYRLVRFARPWSRGLGVSVVARHLSRLHREKRIDALEAHFLYYTGWVGARWARKHGVAAAVMCHGDDLLRDGRYQRRALTNGRIAETVRKAPALIAISGVVERRLVEIDPECGGRVRRVPLGVPPVVEGAALPDGVGPLEVGKFVANVGRLAHGKGVDVLIRAYSQSGLWGRGLKLVIAGDGPEARMLRALAAKQEAAAGIVFTGGLSPAQCATLYAGAAFTVFPSTLPETFGLGLLESLARGTPVLASTTAAYLEVLSGCPVARHYTQNDDGSYLVAALKQCAEDWGAGRRARAGVLGLAEFLKRYDPAEVARMHEEVLLG